MSDQPIASGGTDFIWKLYSGIQKSTKQDVTIFITTKKDIEAKYGKGQAPTIIQRLKYGVSQVCRLRHPHILKLVHPSLIEAGNDIALITEPVLGSLANLCYGEYGPNFDKAIKETPTANQTQSGRIPFPQKPIKNLRLDTLEMRYGLCQVVEALSFLHYDAGTFHLNVNPENIFLGSQGNCWKLGGFEFSVLVSMLKVEVSESVMPEGADSLAFPKLGSVAGALDKRGQKAGTPASPVEGNMLPLAEFGSTLSQTSFVPDINYCAPEYVLNNSPVYETDSFSIGCIFFELMEIEGLLKGGKGVPKLGRVVNCYRNMNTYKKNTQENYQPGFLKFPQSITMEQAQQILRILHVNPKIRLNSQEILASNQIFGETVRALRYLNTLQLQDPKAKIIFLRETFPPMLNNYSERILVEIVVPALTAELGDAQIALFALPSLIFCAKFMDAENFVKLILPFLKDVMQYEQPPKIPLQLLENIDVFLAKTDENQKKTIIVPFFLKTLDSSFADVQIESLKRCQTAFCDRQIAHAEFISQILPKVKEVCRMTSNSVVRINGIVALGKMAPELSQEALNEIVVPVLEHTLKVDKTITVLTTVVGVYNRISKQFDARVIANQIIPKIAPVLSLQTLNQDQFLKVMKTVRSMLDLIEKEKMSIYQQKAEVEIVEKTEIIKEDGTTTQQSAASSQINAIYPKSEQDAFQYDYAPGASKNQQNSKIGTKKPKKPKKVKNDSDDEDEQERIEEEDEKVVVITEDEKPPTKEQMSQEISRQKISRQNSSELFPSYSAQKLAVGNTLFEEKPTFTSTTKKPKSKAVDKASENLFDAILGDVEPSTVKKSVVRTKTDEQKFLETVGKHLMEETKKTDKIVEPQKPKPASTMNTSLNPFDNLNTAASAFLSKPAPVTTTLPPQPIITTNNNNLIDQSPVMNYSATIQPSAPKPKVAPSFDELLMGGMGQDTPTYARVADPFANSPVPSYTKVADPFSNSYANPSHPSIAKPVPPKPAAPKPAAPVSAPLQHDDDSDFFSRGPGAKSGGMGFGMDFSELSKPAIPEQPRSNSARMSDFHDDSDFGTFGGMGMGELKHQDDLNPEKFDFNALNEPVHNNDIEDLIKRRASLEYEDKPMGKSEDFESHLNNFFG